VTVPASRAGTTTGRRYGPTMRCPSCAGHVVRLGRVAPPHRPGHDRFDICECESCGLSFSDPLPPPAVLTDFYISAHPYVDVYGSDHGWQRRQHELDLLRIDRPSGRLLDIGCSFGLLLDVASRSGWDVYGVDPDPAAVEAARGRVGDDRVRVGFADELPVEDWAPFDVISMSHVLEHVVEFRAVLARCADLLAPGGILAIQVPNRRALYTWRRGVDYRPVEHPWYWTYRALATELRGAGLAPRIAPSRLLSRSLHGVQERLKAVALAAERASLRVANYGVKSTLEVHGIKPT
jgi:SAM-dependent methyltransferase